MLELPYTLIDIKTDNENFKLQFTEFDEQSEYSLKMGGVTGKFGIVYISNGINCDFECDITVGNVYDFYISLDNAYEGFAGINPTAILQNYGTPKRTNLSFKFDKKGHICVKGLFLNKSNFYDKCNFYNSGICFNIEIDQTYVGEILNSIDIFLTELKKIQGHGKFF